MRKLILFAVLCALITTGAAVTHAQDDDYCHEGNLSYTNESGTAQDIYVTVYDEKNNEVVEESRRVATVAPGETFDDSVRADAPADDDGDYVFVYSTGEYSGGAGYFDIGPIDPCYVFNDGRLNWTDAAAPAIVYNINNTFIDIYAVNPTNGNGTRVLHIPYENVKATMAEAKETGEHQMIEQFYGIAVYALHSGTCQMNVNGAMYVFEWNCLG